MKELKNLVAPLNARMGVLQLNGYDGLPGPGRDATPLAARVTQKFKEIVEAREADAAAVKLYQRHLAGDLEATLQLNALRTETASNYLVGSANFLSGFFEIVNLKLDERPVFQTTTQNEIGFTTISLEGGVKRRKIQNVTGETLIDLEMVTSEEVEYALMDINNGDISKAAQSTFDIGMDLSHKIDREAKTLLDTAFGAFDTNNANKHLRTFNVHSHVNLSNLPTTNDIVLAGNTNATKFRLLVCEEVVRYCNRFGKAFKDGPLRPTGIIYVPSSDATDIASEITPLTNVNNTVAEGLLQDYTSFRYLGVNWVLVPDETLPPDVCYPQLNKPVGRAYFKPDMDVEETKTERMKNRETRQMAKVRGLYVPTSFKPRAVRVRYRTAS